MNNLELEPTKTTAEITLDAASGELKFSGRSIPEDPGTFFGQVVDWINEYFAGDGKSASAEFNLEYVNSGSSKYFLEIIRLLDDYNRKGKQCSIVWLHEEDDESIQELGELFQDSVGLSFEIRAIMI